MICYQNTQIESQKSTPMSTIFLKGVKICFFIFLAKVYFGNTVAYCNNINTSIIGFPYNELYADTSYLNIAVCDSLFWNGIWYTSSGNYIYSTLNTQGIDSTIILTLNITNSTSSTTNAIACGSYNWNGDMYFDSGTYAFSTTGINGCDSTAILDLTINHPSSLELSVSACESFYWNDYNYTNSGTFFYITNNIEGCDSIVKLSLTINNPTESIIDTVACDVFYWNGEIYDLSGSYLYNTINSNGCDSVIILNLTIVNSSNLTFETIKTCESYEIDGNTFQENGQYIDTLVNINGCDSIVALNLLFFDEIYFPNAFTPNDDNINDIFPDINFELSEFNLTILNSWGQELFNTNNSKKNWDGKFNGKFCEEGVYFYGVNYKCKEKRINKFGQIIILN